MIAIKKFFICLGHDDESNTRKPQFLYLIAQLSSSANLNHMVLLKLRTINMPAIQKLKSKNG